MTLRKATDQPPIIYLLSSRGHIISPPLEWKEDGSVEHTFTFSRELIVNGFIVTHPDGAVLHMSEMEVTRVPADGTYTVQVSIEPACTDPHCDCRKE